MNSKQKSFQNNMGYHVNLPHLIAHQVWWGRIFLESYSQTRPLWGLCCPFVLPSYLELLTPLLNIAVFYSRLGHWYVRPEPRSNFFVDFFA